MNIDNLSDWIWFGAVALWLLFRILPRLFRGPGRSGDRPVAKTGTARPRAPRKRAARTSGLPVTVPELPRHEQDPRINDQLRNPKPIQPR